jgi:hypothetical protein
MRGYILIGWFTLMAYPLWGDPVDTSGVDQPQESAYLLKHEKNLKRMQAKRDVDTEHTRQAQETYQKDAAEMSGDATQLSLDILDLKSLDTQLIAGRNQKISKLDLDPLLENRLSLKEDIQQGGRLVHNEKVLLGIQKRTMDSQARYRAMDDQNIVNEEKTIADNRAAMTQVVRSSEPVRFPK